MTTKSIIFTAALLVTVFTIPAVQAADNNVYIAGQAGLNMPAGDDGEFDNDAVFSAAAGYHLNPNVRIEGELSHRKNDGEDTSLGVLITGETKVTAALVNAYYDFKNTSRFTPYIGAGIGAAHGKIELTGPGGSADEDDNAFAWQGIAGVTYNLTNNVDLTTDYRYFDTANFDEIGADYSAHEIRAGVRYSF